MRHFGTDGIRGKASELTREYLTSIAKAIIRAKEGAVIVIGRDPRLSGLRMEDQLTDALLDYGAKVILCGVLPSPAIAFLTRKLQADYGVVLSASHNPPEYNGVKLFNAEGEKLSDEEERELDGFIDSFVQGNAEPLKKLRKFEALYHYGIDEYIDFLLSAIDRQSLENLKVCLDCSNGSAAVVAPKLFTAAGAKVTAFNTQTNGKNINVNCGAMHPEILIALMQEGEFDIGFTYDGDADRVLAVQAGHLFKGDHLLYLHGKAMKKTQTLKDNTIVGTVMSNMGVQAACEKNGIKLLRTAVGDKFVYREMKKGYNIGGEESGHLIFSDFHTTGDGILSSLLTARLCLTMNLAQEDDIEEFPTVNEQIPCGKAAKDAFYQDKQLQDYLQPRDFLGRIIVRPSGTEPIIRITVEAQTLAEAQAKAGEIRKVLEKRLKL